MNARRLAAALAATVMTAGTVLLIGQPAHATETSSDGARTSMAANPCGMYRDGSAAMYKNCTTANERIFVTYFLGGNRYYCVTPGSTAYVGSWGNTFRVYNRGTC
ncbi:MULTISPECIES: DUF6355 family natural product biosynthesis protein [unclassified Streptosporangium]|uniref:DUF6355 family natural product biosynthesis protein n=1 Tax=unclassified Streptosporangium TaxID=2632669 RepID=UPI002E29C859|nr:MULTISPECIES: DUF6355 family natural product biosynthesis protein [unclassified Streptosporangium]